MNKEKLNHLSSSIYNFICDYRKYSNWYFYDNEIPDLDSVKNILDDEDKGIDFMSEFSDMFYHFSVHKDFTNPKEARFFDTFCSIFKEYNSYLNSYEKQSDIDSLASDLVKYAKDSDPYEYKDLYSSDEDAFESIKKSLFTVSDVDSTIEWLCADIQHYASESDLSNKDILDYFNTANELLIKLNDYSKDLEKQKNQEMDM